MINKKRIFALAIAASSIVGFDVMAATPVGFLGTPISSEFATRTMSLSANTTYINVSYGDVVRFDADGKVFTIMFDGVRHSFDLNLLAPAGALAHTIKVYVSPAQEVELH